MKWPTKLEMALMNLEYFGELQTVQGQKFWAKVTNSSIGRASLLSSWLMPESASSAVVRRDLSNDDNSLPVAFVVNASLGVLPVRR